MLMIAESKNIYQHKISYETIIMVLNLKTLRKLFSKAISNYLHLYIIRIL